MKIELTYWIERGPQGQNWHVSTMLTGTLPSLATPAKGSLLYIPWGDDDELELGALVTESDNKLVNGTFRPFVTAHDNSEINEFRGQPATVSHILSELRREIIPYLQRTGFEVYFHPEVIDSPLPQHLTRSTCKPRRTDNGFEIFNVFDLVWWSDRHPGSLDSMKVKYGEGPFQVVAVRLHNHEARRDGGHPLAITIQLENGDTQEMAGSWFTRRK